MTTLLHAAECASERKIGQHLLTSWFVRSTF